jgi:tetratricopeptide (TPR) repeat protein
MSFWRPLLARWKYLNGWLRLQARRIPSAIAYLERAVSLDGTQAKYLRLLGHAYFQNYDYKLALKAYWKSLDIELPSTEAFHALAFLYALDGNLGLAVAYAEEIVPLDRKKAAETYLDLGTVVYQPMNPTADIVALDNAITFFRRSVQFDTECADAYHKLAERLAFRGLDIPEAVAAYERAGDLYLKQTGPCGRKKRLEQALSAYQRAVELDPSRTDLHPKIGALLSKKVKAVSEDACPHCGLPTATSAPDLTKVGMEFYFGPGGLGGERSRLLESEDAGDQQREAIIESMGKPWRIENATTYSGPLVVGRHQFHTGVCCSNGECYCLSQRDPTWHDLMTGKRKWTTQEMLTFFW